MSRQYLHCTDKAEAEDDLARVTLYKPEKTFWILTKNPDSRSQKLARRSYWSYLNCHITLAKHFSRNQSVIALHLNGGKKKKKKKGKARQEEKDIDTETEQSSRRSHHFICRQKRDWEQMLRLFYGYCVFFDLCFLSVGCALSLSKSGI